jgi:GPH family glycoside/pentoside/hexuronide:cation symporter
MSNSNTNTVGTSIRKFGIRDKIGYAFGDIGSELFFDISSSFLMVYYTDVFKLNPVVVGTIFLLARLWDAFMDVTAGRFIDARPNSKNGKFKPWLLRFAPAYAITGVLMFTHIPGLSYNGYLAYAVVTYLIWGTAFSFINVPFGSMASVITSDSNERTALSTYRNIGAYIAQMSVKTLVPMLAFINNKPDSNRFFITAVVLGVIGMITYQVFGKLCTERVILQKTAERGNILQSLKGITKNKPLIALLSSSLVLLILLMATASLNAYLFKDYFKNTAALALSGSVIILNVLIIAPIVGPLVKKFGKKETGCAGILFSIVAYILLYFVPIKDGYVFVAFKWVADAGYTLFNFVIWAFIGDCIDYHELITGKREDGTIFSFYTFARKLGQSLSGIVSGIVLATAGYVAGKEQTAEVAMKIRDLSFLVPAVLLGVVFLMMTFWYPLNKQKLAKLTEDLAAKREGK